ncbi:HEAT repeat domain-containing protein [Marinicella sediminis]|uniref:HEAT repeat domain-containing protein n=1 Tax=Marinicella sediminis TaxID=1792834 RepID=A0ABV7JCT4_9GAMM|nr:HEAT repeat domain-containing protein [Marinicella sediminis]
MKTLLATLGLLTLSASQGASQPFFNNLNIQSSELSLVEYVDQNKRSDQWFAYSIPAAEETRSMCCYQHGEESVCDLKKSQYGYGSSSDSPLTDQVHFFVHLNNGQVDQVMPVGDHCAVKADGMEIAWLEHVTTTQSLQWLTTQVKSAAQEQASGGLYAISLHPGQAATSALFALATEQQDDYSEQAVFWLGQRQDGFASLQKLLQELPVGEVRRHINFALSQQHSTTAVDLLKEVAQHDQDQQQQADAIFWLSQTDDVVDLPAFLIDLMSHTEHLEIKEKAVFSLSQINTEAAKEALAGLVKDHLDEEVREQALFWLAQNSPDRARPVAMNVLRTSVDASQQEHAVFVLSQLPGKQSSEALFTVVEGAYPRSVKKQALFWLSQSGDDAVISRLEQLF